VFRDVWRVLKDDGTLWLNIGDSYFPHTGTRGNTTPAGDSLRGRDNQYQPAPKLQTGGLLLKGKDLVGIPWRLAFALQADGWYLRQDIIWAKPNPMPESVTDRCTKSHEYVFLLSKSRQYFYDYEAIKEPSTGKSGTWSEKTHKARIGHGSFNKEYVPSDDGLRNKRDVWNVALQPFKGAHFAVMPAALVEPCILAGSSIGDTVLDPFTGSGTVGMVALRHNRNFVGTELNPEYAELAVDRIYNDAPLLNEIEKELANG